MLKNYTLFKAALLDIRNEWAWYLILMTVQPLSLMFFLVIIMKGALDVNSYMIGAITMTFGTGIFLSLGQTFAYYKRTSALDFYLSLPLSKIAVMMSLVFKNIILSLPSTIMLFIIGFIIYGTPVHVGIPFFIAVLLTSLSLASLGTFIGVFSKNIQIASILTQVLTPIFTYLAPVFVTRNQLPQGLRNLSYLIPTTYAANALRYALTKNTFSIDYLILALFAFLCLYFVSKVMDWRYE